MAGRKKETVVVGAGVAGLATAWALAQRGASVTVLEQFEVGHARGSSHGSARIFRLSYPEAKWVRLAHESLALWRELEGRMGGELLRTTGSLDLGPDLPHPGALDECGVPYEQLDAPETLRRFGVGAPGVYQRDGGVVLADRALAAFRDGAVEAGARLQEGVRVSDLDEVDGDTVVVTAGAWAPKLGLDLPVRVTRETVSYFDVGRESLSIVDWSGDHVVYALSTPEGRLKVGVHHAGTDTDPDEEGVPDPVRVRAASAWVAERFGPAEPAYSETCLYTTTPDESFILERRGRYVIGSACSGHGFKFAPAIGRRLARLALDG